MTKIKYLDQSELNRLFEVIKGSGSVRDLILYSFAYRYGLRVSEIVQIRLSDLSPSPYRPVQLSVRRVKAGIDRVYPVSYQDTKILKRWLKLREKIDGSEHCGFLFCTARSGTGHISIDTVKGNFTRYALQAGIERKKCHVHVLRHSIAVSLLSGGQDIYFVQSYLGHKSLNSTLVYASLMPQSWQSRSFLAVESLAT